jgi:hypothetical protein
MKTTVVTKVRQHHAVAGLLRFFSVILIAGFGMATSCSDDDGNGDKEPEAEAGCRVKTQTTMSRLYAGTPDEYTYKSVFTYSYDDKGNQLEYNVQYNNDYIDGKKATSTSSGSMQYDNDSFLLRGVWQYNATDKDGVTRTSNRNEEYTYENGRLIKEAVTSTDDGKTTNYVFQYEYDGEGKVIKYSNTYNNTSTVITYNGKIVQKITITDGAGNVTSPFVQYNDKGWVTKAIETWSGGTDEYRYEYNTDGEITKEERYINSKPSSGTIFEYDTRESPSRYTSPQLKGHPVLPSTRPNYRPIHNVTRATYLENNADQTAFQNRASTLYVYDYNAKGFPTGFTLTQTNNSGAVEATQTSTYAYTNCD